MSDTTLDHAPEPRGRRVPAIVGPTLRLAFPRSVA
jgi:hypothetical protein